MHARVLVRHALLIGAQIGELRGVHQDVEHMAAVLRERGFDVDARTKADASRTGIVEGLRALEGALGGDDVGLVYFAGHGARLVTGSDAAKALGKSAPREVTFLVPTDFDDRTRHDFRGITRWELSSWLAAFTARTPNIVAIFDCCHAARIVRGAHPDRPVARGLPYPSGDGLVRHLEALKAAGTRFDRLDALGNPDAVRLFACAETGQAWEDRINGVHCGVMTEALVRYLRQVGDRPVSWNAVFAAVRARVRVRCQQEPEIAGPSWRTLYSRDANHTARAVSLALHGQRAVLRAGKVAGLCRGDVYAAVPIANADDKAAVITRLTVTEVAALEAFAEPDSPGTFDATDGVVAYAEQSAHPPCVLGCRGAGEIRDVLEKVEWLRIADETTDDALATLELSGDGWMLRDDIDVLAEHVAVVATPAEQRSRSIHRLLEILANLVAARTMLDGRGGLDAASIEVVLRLADDGSSIDQPVAPGERIELHVGNRADVERHVHVFAVEPHGAIARLSASHPQGIIVAPHDSHVLGRVTVGPSGFRVRWPEALPQRAKCDIELVVIAATHPIDLGFLERRMPDLNTTVRSTPQWRDIAPPDSLTERVEPADYVAVRRCYQVCLPA